MAPPCPSPNGQGGDTTFRRIKFKGHHVFVKTSDTRMFRTHQAGTGEYFSQSIRDIETVYIARNVEKLTRVILANSWPRI